MADLTHLFKVGQKVMYKNDDFDAIEKFIPCVVKETYQDHIIITDIETDTDLWCEEGFNMDCVFPEYGVVDMHELAKAFTYIDMEQLDMGDSHEEIISFLCEKAEIEFDSDCSDEDEHYYKEKSIDAYEKLLRTGKIHEIIESIIDGIYDNYDYIRTVLVYNENESPNINEHPTVKALCLINNYIQNVNSEKFCSKEHCLKLSEVIENMLSIDIELCYVGHELGHSFFRHLNPDFYFRSNDVFTVGHILGEDETERKLGEYTIHAAISPAMRKCGDDQGYTIAFNRNDKGIAAHLYVFTKTFEPLNMEHQDTGCEINVNIKDLDAAAEELANKINELTEKDFLNSSSSLKNVQNEQMEINSVRRRKGR